MFFPSLLMTWNIFVCLVFFNVNVCINGCICRGVCPESNLWNNIYLSLAWNSLIRLVWLASDPRHPAISASLVSRLNLKPPHCEFWRLNPALLFSKPFTSWALSSGPVCVLSLGVLFCEIIVDSLYPLISFVGCPYWLKEFVNFASLSFIYCGYFFLGCNLLIY